MKRGRFTHKNSFKAYLASLCISLMGLILMLAPVAQANISTHPVPRLKPDTPNISSYLSDKDAKHFRSGIRAAQHNNWSKLTSSVRRIKDPTARDILIWIRSMRDPHVSLQDMTYVTQSLSDWPRMTGIQAKAEGYLFDNPMSAQNTLDWFGDREPVSGEGRAALARAYYRLGDNAKGYMWLKRAWREARLTRDRQKKLYRSLGKHLTPEDHAARADHLIWLGRSRFSKANGLLSLMPKADRRLMEARMKLASNKRGMDAAVNAVPASLKNDTGLLFERARWRRRKKSKSYALPVYLDIDTAPISEQGKKRLWREKKIMIYWALAEDRFDTAYQLTQNHGFTRGTEFAEAEFLAGWVALVKQDRAAKALEHFTALKTGVSYPVSLSRAGYWQGRAAERLGHADRVNFYASATQYPNTYYGQLAAEKLNGANAVIRLPLEINPADTADSVILKASYDADIRVRAMHILGEFGEERFFNLFAFHLDDEFEDIRHLTLLSQTSRQYGFMRPALRSAKQAARFGSMLTDSGYPVIDTITALPPEFNIAFVHAIARQESEFEPTAISSAKAYGMMQMINGTAKATARKHRIPYNRSRLTADPDYNVRLGALHLHDLLEEFDGSYIMAAAAYNAGPHRARQWARTLGDPRRGTIDPIDWVESIPFTETRNYVQRVMENIQVYRARLNGNEIENTLWRDLTLGAF